VTYQNGKAPTNTVTKEDNPMKKPWPIATICLSAIIISLACAPLSRDTQATKIAGDIFAVLTEEAPTATPKPTETPPPTETPTPTPSPSPTALPTLSLPTATPTPTDIVGTWIFAPHWEDPETESKPFKIVFHRNGSLTYYQKSESDAEGKWEQNGKDVKFDVNDYSFWEGTFETDRMAGTMYNEGGLEGTWVAIRDFTPQD
jgi:hypothetical protein